ncbi:MAG: hypothetical protein H8D67_08660 [Deltaproteobacteria bacterium]|nr:hypothetical protein [Deltaproteobacteria bacterium]MBL7174838.1 hypothetical protein [Desulfobacteraceae bacterium]
MKGVILVKSIFLFLTLLLICGPVFLMIRKSHADPLDALHAVLPQKIKGWKAVKEEDRSFDSVTIFDYIDGAGEVYRAYNMQRCLSRRYTTSNGPPIVMDIFDMGSSEDAFGVFTHDQDGEALDTGQGALYRPGWLSFWKDRFFVSIYAEEETAAVEKTVRDLGKVVSSLIKDQGPKPRILLKLPQEGLQPRSTRFLHHYIILNYHFYLADRNILNLGPQTDAVLARYLWRKQRARLLLVNYPNVGKAAEARISFFMHYLPDADSTGVALLEDGKWSAAAAKGTLLAVVLESDTRQLAQSLLKRVMASSP